MGGVQAVGAGPVDIWGRVTVSSKMTYVVPVVIFKSELVVSIKDVVIFADHSSDVTEPFGVEFAICGHGAWGWALTLWTFGDKLQY